MGFQVAYQRVHNGEVPAVYESCSTRNFLHGRTETIRSSTAESNAFCRAMTGAAQACDVQIKKELLQIAAHKHIEVAKLAAVGMGIDRHFYAMKSIAQETDNMHDLLSDPIFIRSQTWNLSTSNVTAEGFDLFGFGPTASNGYGIGYLIFADNIPMNITAFNDCEVTDTNSLAQSLESTLLEMRTLF